MLIIVKDIGTTYCVDRGLYINDPNYRAVCCTCFPPLGCETVAFVKYDVLSHDDYSCVEGRVFFSVVQGSSSAKVSEPTDAKARCGKKDKAKQPSKNIVS